MLKPFAPVPNGYILLVRRGVYRVSKLFTLDGVVYAKHGGGYVRVHHTDDKSTSCRGVHWIDVSGVNVARSKLGHMIILTAEEAAQNRPKAVA